ncbi:hypothetical protein HDU98_007460 [Podochytrium sp. JEL0797]|nr:hypothetical protein HDU98_007460 [Podochytrium sp. JEL0797]
MDTSNLYTIPLYSASASETDPAPHTDQRKKKPGRKAIRDTPQDKRVAQNRQAQRAFRERKEAHLASLEALAKSQKEQIDQLMERNSILQRENEILRHKASSSTSPPLSFHQDSDLNINLFTQIQDPRVVSLSPSQSASPHIAPPSANSPGIQQRVSSISPSVSSRDVSVTDHLATTPLLNPPSTQLPLNSQPSVPDPNIVVPEFKATLDFYETQADCVLNPQPVRITHLSLVNSALKQLPSLENKDIVDELCERYLAFTTKCSFQDMPHPDAFPVSDIEHQELVMVIDRVQRACLDPADGVKAKQIIELGIAGNRQHYERLSFIKQFSGGGSS